MPFFFSSRFTFFLFLCHQLYYRRSGVRNLIATMPFLLLANDLVICINLLLRVNKGKICFEIENEMTCFGLRIGFLDDCCCA